MRKDMVICFVVVLLGWKEDEDKSLVADENSCKTIWFLVHSGTERRVRVVWETGTLKRMEACNL